MMRPPDTAQVIARLAEARERIASGWPSVALALAGTPLSTAQARIQEAEEARYASEPAKPWVQVLTDSLVAVEEARAMWDGAPDVMPPAASDMPPCALDLRLPLAGARACAEKGLAWEDAAGLTRAQALCVLHLSVCLAQWRAAEQRHAAATEKAQTEVERGRQERAAVAARAIWAQQPKTQRSEPMAMPRSLRDLASVANAFADWGEEDAS